MTELVSRVKKMPARALEKSTHVKQVDNRLGSGSWLFCMLISIAYDYLVNKILSHEL